MTLSQARRRLGSAGLFLSIEKDATEGHEFSVSDASGTVVAYGWSGGTKSEAAAEAVSHPAIALRLASAAQVQS